MPYYRLADVYATASLHEGFGVPLIEAMASGVPVVASNATAHPWVLGDAGLLAQPDDAADLAKQIREGVGGRYITWRTGATRTCARQGVFAGTIRSRLGKNCRRSTEWLPQQPFPRLRRLGSTSASSAPALAEAPSNELKWLATAADVMQRNYVVHSNAPLIGPLIAWVRRNLTSHLREPYVDPTLERQVTFNREVVRTLQRLLARTDSEVAGNTAQQIAQLEAQIAKLQDRIAILRANKVESKD